VPGTMVVMIGDWGWKRLGRILEESGRLKSFVRSRWVCATKNKRQAGLAGFASEVKVFGA
jgi:hypothetical protein